MSSWKPSRRQTVLIGAFVATDLAAGIVLKGLLHATGVGSVLRLDMVFAVVLMLLTRMILDRFGALTLYQTAWGVSATLLLPAAVLPGPLKLVPLVAQGLAMDGVCQLRWLGPLRWFLAAVTGFVVSFAIMQGFRIGLLGFPWTRATQLLLGAQGLSLVGAHLVGAGLALVLFRRIEAAPLLGLMRESGS